MKSFYNVVGAAVVKDGKLLSLRRRNGIDSVIHKFEFVGGKVWDGEDHRQALKRECREKLSLEVDVGELLTTVGYEYPEYAISLEVYLCKMLSGYRVTQHEEEAWIDCDNLRAVDWAPADAEFVNILKRGYVKLKQAVTPDDFAVINRLGAKISPKTLGAVSSGGQTDLLNPFLTDSAIRRNIGEKGYVYKIVQLNGEDAGFFTYCPASNFDVKYQQGTYLSDIYLNERARGKKISTKIFGTLPHPVVLSVKREDAQSVKFYKHCGFKVVGSYSDDIGQGYILDNFIMKLG